MLHALEGKALSKANFEGINLSQYSRINIPKYIINVNLVDYLNTPMLALVWFT